MVGDNGDYVDKAGTKRWRMRTETMMEKLSGGRQKDEQRPVRLKESICSLNVRWILHKSPLIPCILKR